MDEFMLGELKIEDTNLAGIGSEEDKALRKAAAETEEAWQGCGQSPGIEIWRVEQFKVVPWPKEDYGNFYEGDSYVVLNTRVGEADELFRDAHFWLGLKTSVDEQGTAAYKCVELCDLFDGMPVQHREVMAHESPTFKSYFEDLVYMKGGCKTGFKHVEEGGAYAPRLLIVKRVAGKVHAVEVPTELASLNQGDAFLLDAGAVVYKWFGDDCSPFEKQAAATIAMNIENQRCGATQVTDDITDEFWELLGGPGDIQPASAVTVLPEPEPVGEGVLFKLLADGGDVKWEEVARGDLSKDMLESDNVYICDAEATILLWIGEGASDVERRKALVSVTDYLYFSGKPPHTPVSVMREGQGMRVPFDAIFQQ